jgi:hypothetical protein
MTNNQRNAAIVVALGVPLIALLKAAVDGQANLLGIPPWAIALAIAVAGSMLAGSESRLV